MTTHLPDQSTYEMKSPGYMLDRSIFDKELAASAVQQGAHLSVQTRVTGLTRMEWLSNRGGKKVHSFESRYRGRRRAFVRGTMGRGRGGKKS